MLDSTTVIGVIVAVFLGAFIGPFIGYALYEWWSKRK